MKFYAGIGSRQTPQIVLDEMTQIASQLFTLNYVLRSGGAIGADTAFAKGAVAKQIFRPNGAIPDDAFYEAASVHPAWHNCNEHARRLHARNAQIVLGENLDEPARFVLCWTRVLNPTMGGTKLGMDLAKKHDIPVINMLEANWLQHLEPIL